jgi:hypothetical protein
MTWNIFKRVAELEQKVTHLNDQLVTQGQVLTMLHNQIRARNRSSEADREKEKKRLYHRAWREKNKLSEDARERKNAYARAYYARTKGENK